MSSCGNSKSTDPAETIDTNQSEVNKALEKNTAAEEKISSNKLNAEDLKALLEIKKEKKVSNAYITDQGNLYAEVEDDGTRRDGYAEYLALVLKEHGASVKKIIVLKRGTVRILGTANAFK